MCGIFLLPDKPHPPLLLVIQSTMPMNYFPCRRSACKYLLAAKILSHKMLAWSPTPLITHRTPHHSSIERKPSAQNYWYVLSGMSSILHPRFRSHTIISVCEILLAWVVFTTNHYPDQSFGSKVICMHQKHHARNPITTWSSPHTTLIFFKTLVGMHQWTPNLRNHHPTSNYSLWNFSGFYWN